MVVGPRPSEVAVSKPSWPAWRPGCRIHSRIPHGFLGWKWPPWSQGFGPNFGDIKNRKSIENQGYINGIPTVLWFFLPPGRFLVWYLDTCRTHRNHHFPGSFVNSTTFPPAMSTPFRLHLKSGENFVVGPQKIPLALKRVEKWRRSVGWWRLPLGCWTSFIQTKTQPTKLGDVFARHRAWRIVQSLERCRNHSPRSPVTSNHQDILTNVLRTKIILRNQPLTFYDPKPFSSAYHLQSRLMWTHVLLIQNFEVYVILVSISTYVHLYTQASFEETHRPRVIYR